MKAATLINTAGASGIALEGYDPVAFFTMNKAVHGDPGISSDHNGAKYLFANDEHKHAFDKDPEAYVPQFGGFCAFGVSLGALFPADISTWQIRDGKLYFNLNPDILESFNGDFDACLTKAEAEWPGLESSYATKPVTV